MDNRTQSSTCNVRHYEIDWLTVIATAIVFLYHCARYFNDEGWHVKNPVHSEVLSYAVIAVTQWIMPLFFFLSGMSSGHSLQRRTVRAYLADRAKRLALPFLFSVFVVSIPFQVWVERVTNNQFSGSFLEFYPHYFDGFYAFGGNFAWMGLHLWYLLLLFLFSLLTLPFFLLFAPARFRALWDKIVAYCPARLGAFCLALPLCAVEYGVNLDPEGLGMRAFGGWSPLSYLCVFLIGGMVASGPACRESFKKCAPVALACGVLTTLLLLLAHAGITLPGGGQAYLAAILLRSLNSWFWVMAIYGFGCRHLAFGNAALLRLREVALPFYILHQTVIVGIGYALVRWNIPILFKFTVLAAGSLVLLALLVLGIQQHSLSRFLFGMRRRIPEAATLQSDPSRL